MSDPTGTLVPFHYGDAEVRVVQVDGEPWWVAADVARILGYTATAAMTRSLDHDEKGVRTLHTPGGEQEMTVISESGLYSTILRSRVERAADFRRWVTREVLPSIRRTGSYGASAFDPASLSRQEILRLALNAEEERLALEAQNKVLAPKAEAYDDFLDATGKFGVGAVAKMLGSSQNKMFRDLRNAGVFIAKGPMRNTPYQKYMHHFEVKAHTFERSNGEQGTSYTTYVQPSGIDFIRRKLGLLAIDPLPMSEAVAS